MNEPPSAAARMAAVKACTVGRRLDPRGASRITSYICNARSVSPFRVQTSIKVVHMRQSGRQPACIASSHTCVAGKRHDCSRITPASNDAKRNNARVALQQLGKDVYVI